MHYILDNNETFDGQNPLEKPGNEVVWREIMDAMHANGDNVTMASSGVINDEVYKKRGFHKNEFSDMLPETSKNQALLNSIAEKHKISVSDICVIDNDSMSVWIIKKLGAQAIEYKGAHDLKEQLSTRKMLSFDK